MSGFNWISRSLDLLRFLRRLNSEWRFFETSIGEVSRFGLIRIAFRLRRLDLTDFGNEVLIDHSAQKAGGTLEMFGVKVPAVNPYECLRGIRWRTILLTCSVLPERPRRVVAAAAFARSLSHQSSHIERTYFWNPGNLTQFALTLCLPRPHVYVLAPEYPPVRNADRVYACQTIHEIQGTPPDRRVNLIRRHRFATNEVKFVFYMTQLVGVTHPEYEEHLVLRLLDYVVERARVPIEVRAHYHDLEHGLPAWFTGRYNNFIVYNEPYSLDFISSNQMSFSGSSSIGYELMSLGVLHGVVQPLRGGYRSQRMCPELADWFQSSPCVLDVSADLDNFSLRFARAYSERLASDGSSLLLDGRRVLV